ncbi:predicted protein [Histoplasma capsulatum G186AR]|uniref:Uncharacterized protein n=1 Tax=Ajellomyces capsulatus (strain G186AR / H82 / ATCC MYA-2454 / RMSCC 2432) TaxID=447093 RepID=C0NNC8_AJECG|nr:uncharacterized protein HCBG_04255 [Histoplasma capsulatum G186AR]EEH07376.1 predicted protein [Histoplasma capsulatum G186AR]
MAPDERSRFTGDTRLSSSGNVRTNRWDNYFAGVGACGGTMWQMFVSTISNCCVLVADLQPKRGNSLDIPPSYRRRMSRGQAKQVPSAGLFWGVIQVSGTPTKLSCEPQCSGASPRFQGIGDPGFAGCPGGSEVPLPGTTARG